MSYNLYKTILPSLQEEWTVLLIPKAVMSLGDTFTIRVNFTGGSYKDFFITVSYVLTDWAKIITYNGTPMPSSEGTNTNPLTYSAASLEVVFSKPLDEDGNILDGLSYSIRVGTSEATGGGTFSVPTNVTETSITDPGSTTPNVEVNVSTITAETYYVCPVAESADGQRNGEEVWFTKN